MPFQKLANLARKCSQAWRSLVESSPDPNFDAYFTITPTLDDAQCKRVIKKQGELREKIETLHHLLENALLNPRSLPPDTMLNITRDKQGRWYLGYTGWPQISEYSDTYSAIVMCGEDIVARTHDGRLLLFDFHDALDEEEGRLVKSLYGISILIAVEDIPDPQFDRLC